MDNQSSGIPVEILGKTYYIKCAPNEEEFLLRAAKYFEEQISLLRKSGNTLGFDKIMILAALNITHQYLNLENQIEARLNDLQNKITESLSAHLSQEVSSTG